jgi:hypothetical protein
MIDVEAEQPVSRVDLTPFHGFLLFFDAQSAAVGRWYQTSYTMLAVPPQVPSRPAMRSG